MRLPTYTGQQPMDTGRGTMPNPTIDDSIGVGLQRLGGQITNLAQVLKARRDQQEDFQAEANFIRFAGERDQAILDSTQNLPPGATGYAETSLLDFNTAADEFIRTQIPERLRPEYYNRLLTMQNSVLDTTSRIEFTERNRYVTGEIENAGTLIANRVMMSPADVQMAIEEIDELILRSGLPPIEAAQLSEAWRLQLIDASIMGQIQQDPTQAYVDLGGTVPPGNLALGMVPEARTAIQEAAAATGINPNYLALTVGAESGAGAFMLPRQSVQPAGQYMTAENFQSQYYRVDQLSSHDGGGLRIDVNAVRALDNMTTILGGHPLNISSGYRTPQHNETVDGASNSQHIHGTAFDILLPSDPAERQRILAAAMQAGFTGFGFYADRPDMLHVDTRGTVASWYWGGNGRETPEWAAPVWNEFIRTRGAVDALPEGNGGGPFQFQDDTWLSMMRQHAPKYGLSVEGLSDDQLLDLRSNTRWSTLMAAEYAVYNRGIMEGQLGRAITPGELYLGHFMGGQGAVDLIRYVQASPDGTAAAIFPEAAAANRSVFYDGDTPRTFQEVYNEVIRRFEAQGAQNQPTQGQVNPLYQELPYDRINTYQTRAIDGMEDQQRQVTALEADRQSRMAADYTSRLGSIERSIYEDPTYGHMQLRAEGLQDDDYVRLARQIDQRDSENADLRVAFERYNSPSAQYSPFVGEDRDQVDLLWGAFDENNELLRGMTTDGADGLAEMVRRTGIVPETAVGQLLTMARGNDVAQMGYALTLGNRIMEDFPDAFHSTEGADQLMVDIIRWNDLTETQGMDYAAAAARMTEDRQPITRERLRDLAPLADAYAEGLEVGALIDYFDNKYGDVFGTPGAGFLPEGETALMAEFRSFAREAFLHEANGNSEVATQLAMTRMDRLYGVTRIFGSPTIMRHPPERTYGPVGQSMEYFTQQLQAEVETYFAQEIALEDIVVYTYPQTDRDVQSGATSPRYAVGAYTTDEATGQRVFNWMYAAFVPDRAYAEQVWSTVAQGNLQANQTAIINQTPSWLTTGPIQGRQLTQTEMNTWRWALDLPEAGDTGPIPMPIINYVPFELQQRRARALGINVLTGQQFPPIQITAPDMLIPRGGIGGVSTPPLTDMPRDYRSQPVYNTPQTEREVEPLDRAYELLGPPTAPLPQGVLGPDQQPLIIPDKYTGAPVSQPAPFNPAAVPDEPPDVPDFQPAADPGRDPTELEEPDLLPRGVTSVRDLTPDIVQRAVDIQRAWGGAGNALEGALQRIADLLGVSIDDVRTRLREMYE